jgi:DNA-binding response OmpR family regulator
MNAIVRRILLVEDSRNDAELTLGELGKHMHSDHIEHVKDGEEALDYLRRRGRYASRGDGNPLVVLLDLKLPKVSGLEVLREVKGDPVLRTTPVVVLTSSREERDIVESYKLGVNGYVVKPVGFPEFVAAIRALGLFWAILNEPPPPTAR